LVICGVCFCAAAEQRRLPSGWLKRRLAITQTAEQRLVKMAAHRVVVAAVAQAVSELQFSEADRSVHTLTQPGVAYTILGDNTDAHGNGIQRTI